MLSMLRTRWNAFRRPKGERGEQLPPWKLIAFAAPAIPLSVMNMPITVYLPPFYAEEMGISLTTLGIIFMVTRLWDGFTDPILGIISDRFPSRWGRRRHWMVIGAPILMVTIFMVFMPQYVVGETASPFYLLATMIVMYVGYTVANLSHEAWGAELSTYYHERTRVMAWRHIVNFIGMAAVLSLPAFVEQTGDATSNGTKVELMGWYVIILLPIFTALAVFTVGEKPVKPVPRISYRKAITTLLENTMLMRIVVMQVFVEAPFAVMGVLYVFFVTYVVESPEWISIAMLGFFVSTLLATPLWVKISALIGKHRAVTLGVALHAPVTLGYLLLGPGDIIGFEMVLFTEGLVFGGTFFLVRSIMADIADYDHVVSGEQRTGLIYAVFQIASKLGPALAIVVALPMVEWMGFDPAAEQQSAAAIDGLRYTFVVLPVVATIIAASIMYSFPLDEQRQIRLREELEQRSAET